MILLMMHAGNMMDNGNSWGGGFGMFFMLIFWIIIIVGIVFLVVWLVNQNTRKTPPSSEKSALDILKERYARGEIRKEEFEEKKKGLV